MNKHIVFTLTGHDRVGLVQEIMNVMVRHSGNVETSRMARLGGEFAMLALVDLEEKDLAGFEADLGKLREEGFQIALTQTESDHAKKFAGWLPYQIEVIGAVDELRSQGDRSVAFQVWSVFEVPDRRARGAGSKGSSLEPLVRYPKGAEGREITVEGRFRGANLFEDLEPESRRRASDWVLQDGPFSIWVTGKAPKGKGFSLDPRSRSDCRFRLEATGKVSTANGFIYLRASNLQLLGRAKAE